MSFGLSIFFPGVRAGNNLRGAIFFCELINRPNCTELGFNSPWNIATPKTTISMEYLCGLSWANTGRLSKMQLVTI
jgi:hypothetical protein